MKQTKVYNLLVVDESGSMEVIKKQTINGCNETLQTIRSAQEKYPEQSHLVTLVFFNSEHKTTILDCAPISDAKMINASTYKPDCGTPLYDALGESLTRLRYKINQKEDHHVLITILTDGEENASKEFNHRMINKMIDELKQAGWTFTFIGANINVEQVAAQLSVNNYISFEQTDEGTQSMFLKENDARMSFFDKMSKGQSKEELSKNYFDEK
ncbi:MAG: vWA domain-containing protein [Mariniphaga sp.]